MNRRALQAKRTNRFNTSTSFAEIPCLLTGFDPFNDSYQNPSAAIVEAMPPFLKLSKSCARVEIQTLVLPSIGAKAWKILQGQIDGLPKNRQSIIIMLGQAANRKIIGLERFALNFRDYKIKDNAGQMIDAQTIDLRAPDAIKTKAPTEEALRFLQDKGALTEGSNFAGTFVCNETYFLALNYVRVNKLPHLVYFVHVPLPRVFGKSLAQAASNKWRKYADGKERQIEAMTETVKLLIEFNAGFVTDK